MPKYSLKPINCKEKIKTLRADSKEQAIEFFAQVKVLPIEKFIKLYEVIEEVH